jgi:gliding motility-associated-like protein
MPPNPMKKLSFLVCTLLLSLISFANHITGGEMYYTLTDHSGNNYTYHVVLKLYRDCNAPPGAAPLDDAAPISIFNNATFVSVWAKTVDRKTIVHRSLDNPNPCINNPPVVCYDIGYYEFDVTLPGVAQGYTIAYQRCCRIAGINNLIGSSNVGATYTAEIPGTAGGSDGPANNSAQFIGEDRVIVCANNAFIYDFGAKDADPDDSLSYSFCSAYTGGTTSDPAPKTPANPPYSSVPYSALYNASSPLGPTVNLNTKTGLITGIAPAVGIYVVTVCVSEYRKGVLIATQRKDLQIKIGDCSLTTPALDPQYITCDGFNLTFTNHNSSSLIHTYEWSFGDGSTPSSDAKPIHIFADTGIYKVKLVVNRGELCSDSATSLAKVYPGFFPGFTSNGVCVNKPTQFLDTSHTVYGFIDSWKWDFGDLSSNTDVSQLQNPTYTYKQTGTKDIRFIVTSNKGCIDTITQKLAIIDKPLIQLKPADTLICNGDNVQLSATGNGVFSWTGINISNPNAATVTVSPTATSNYIVTLNDDGCVNTDTVHVRVIDFVTLRAMPDTVICAGDSLQLTAVTDGLLFNWTPAATINNPGLLRPFVLPKANTTYQITATVGHCSTTDDVTIRLVPYPSSNAGQDTVVCFDTKAQLNAGIVGSSFTWTPSSSLDNPNSLHPVASPRGTTSYVLTVFDNLGCPKPKRDTVVVTVLPKINAFAGRDTAVVVGQQLQLNASGGGGGYFWAPSTYLNRNNVKNPIGIYDGRVDSIRYKVLVGNDAGCFDSAYITVKVFRTNPQIFVPTAFTPNGDGLNDYVRPIAVGISRMDYFRIYNRWGQLVFSANDTERGWDGKIGGKDQPSATFVWIVKGTDFTGKVVFAKGTVTLIR